MTLQKTFIHTKGETGPKEALKRRTRGWLPWTSPSTTSLKLKTNQKLSFKLCITWEKITATISLMSPGKCSVCCRILLWNVTTHRWLHKCSTTWESISNPCDLTWFYMSLSFQDNFFFFINIDAVIKNTAISMLLTLLILI